MNTNLDPKYLRTNTAKQLLNASYQLETLSKKASIERIMSYKTDEQIETPMTDRNKFVETLKQGVVKVANRIKRQLVLSKQVRISRFTGPDLRSISNFKKHNQNEKEQEQEI